ncbi:MFS transporter [Arsenicibacter rosenii]|uniref:MFS transporter n=1 Tax=Arsenicibacter rosenii TaxID=1750698 RepID=A0A1S2VRV2_9BACT|nr:MFS transporter [Arsenicibacter rosenii]OIN61045.1 MFS transporter [Arsenicibacter rosenii]
MQAQQPVNNNLSPYQKGIIAILAFIQFTVVLDFMVLSPLGAQLLTELSITTAQFGWVVSGYAFSAGVSGLLTAGFADRFDRKKLLLFFYSGFVLGTLFCGLAPNFEALLAARIITGLFGGVISSIGFAIITDLFDWQMRGRVMGFVQMSFAASQVLGIPVGLFLANNYGWHSPFRMIVAVSILVGLFMVWYMKPVTGHLTLQTDNNPFRHLMHTVSQPTYLRGFAATVLLATGGFMLMPFGSTYAIHNLGVTADQLPLIYTITGVFSIGLGPIMGRLSDKTGKFNLFTYASIWGIAVTIIYCNLGQTPLWGIIGLNVLLFVGISGRMISSQAMISAVPEAKDRGAFMSVNASIQQVAGGVASLVAGLIVVQRPDGYLEQYPLLGYIVSAATIITIFMMRWINNHINKKQAGAKAVPPAVAAGDQVA